MYRQITDAELWDIESEMLEAEINGDLDGLFQGECILPPGRKPSRAALLHSIKPDMKLYRSLFIKIFAYDQTTPGFAEDALTRLEILGCSKARNYYTCITAEWQHEHDKEMRNVAAWYKKQYYEKKGSEELRKRQREAEQRKAELLSRKKRLLTQKSQLLTRN